MECRSFAPPGNHQLQISPRDTLFRRHRRAFGYVGEIQLSMAGKGTKSTFNALSIPFAVSFRSLVFSPMYLPQLSPVWALNHFRAHEAPDYRFDPLEIRR